MEELLTIIGNYAFPIAACIALFWKLDKDESRHKEEIDNLRNSYDKNTQVLTELATLIRAERGD